MCESGVNAAGDDRSLGMQNWRPSWRPSQGSCLPRQNAVVSKRRNEMFYVAACSGGASSITVEVFGGSHTDGRGNPVWGPLVRYEVKAPVDGFDIELVFMDNGVYNTQEREWLRDAADRWERIITEGLPDVSFASNPQEFSLGTEQTVTVRDRVDDLRIYVYAVNEPESRAWAWGGAEWVRWGVSWLPSVASVAFNEPKMDDIERNNGFYSAALHEIGHCLGFSDWFWTPERLDLIRLPSKNYPGTDAHFIGSNAIATFNRLGGLSYRGNKVPLENREARASRDGHWRHSVFQNEVMDPYIEGTLSEITIAAFEDMGYEVDYSQADAYRIPRAAAKSVAHPTRLVRGPGAHRGYPSRITQKPVEISDLRPCGPCVAQGIPRVQPGAQRPLTDR